MNWGISESEINKSASPAAVSDSLFLGKDKIKIVTFLGMQDLKSFKSQLIGYLFGGTKMDGDRLIWWNFVASSRDLMEEAKQRWREQRFGAVPDETEFIPLPEDANK